MPGVPGIYDVSDVTIETGVAHQRAQVVTAGLVLRSAFQRRVCASSTTRQSENCSRGSRHVCVKLAHAA